MKKGFWAKLKTPFFMLAPMANVTDVAFRRIISKKGKPDVFYTEFVSADGLDSAGRERLLPDLLFDGGERPIVAQIFSSNPEKIKKASALVRELGFDGVDINMGCPDKAVMKQGAGAALARDYDLAQRIIFAAKEGAGPLPVSVKIRLGDTKNQIEDWLPALLETRPAAVTIHGRTRKEMSKVPARWEDIARAVEVRNEWSLACNLSKEEQTLIVGNGDVSDLADAKRKAAESLVDGVMLGRAIFGNPWLFNTSVSREEISERERLVTLLEHAEAFQELLGDVKPFHIMRKHFGSYVSGFKNAKELREQLMLTETLGDVRLLIERELSTFETSG